MNEPEALTARSEDGSPSRRLSLIDHHADQAESPISLTEGTFQRTAPAESKNAKGDTSPRWTWVDVLDAERTFDLSEDEEADMIAKKLAIHLTK